MATTSRRPVLTRAKVIVPVLLAVALVIAFVAIFTRLYTDLLFYRSVDFSKVFTTVIYTRILLFLIFGAVM
ncbi:UPF0182 family protein, partial [Frankia sp. AvcI1]